MGCSNCKKKNTVKKHYATKQNIEKSKIVASQSNIKNSPKQNIFDIDKVVTWIVIGWFLLGIYGLYSLIKNLINVLT